jgi:excisionase family DNA binding protein
LIIKNKVKTKTGIAKMEVYTIKETAELLKISITRLRSYIKTNQIKPFKIAKKYRFNKQVINDFINNLNK